MDTLQGAVERITFYSAENGYTVLRLHAPGQMDLVTVVGNLPEVQPGESLKLYGEWMNHPKHGKQFKAERCEQVLPATIEGLKKYLGSGLVKGIGPVMAGRIVKKFGLQTLDVLDHHPEQLRQVLGIGPMRAGNIGMAWTQQKAIKDVMLFLQSHGVSATLAVKIYKQYGDASVATVKDNPYQLASDIYGVGFKTADKIARDLGLPMDSPQRIAAGIAYTLSQLADEGHVYAPEGRLVDDAAELLGATREQAAIGIDKLIADGQVKAEVPPPLLPQETGEGLKAGVREERAVYLTPFYYGETGVAAKLRAIMDAPAMPLSRKSGEGAGVRAERIISVSSTGTALSEQQVHAVQMLLSPSGKVMVLTGGPGTGKTTTVRAMIEVCEKQGLRYALASPTGRAAKRLAEATGRPAKTIHRLLEFSPQEGFKHNAENPLPIDLLIVDEASMLDLLLANHLLKALTPDTRLLLVGDVDQLPSVGAGDVLRDVIASGRAQVIRLDVIFRQAQDSLIVTNAHRINKGQFPEFPKNAHDFFMFTQDDPDEAATLIVDLVTNRIPKKFGLTPADIQVLAPMYRGAAGVMNLNTLLQAALNPPVTNKPERKFGGTLLRVGDRVMQMRNNYDKDVFNGDIGIITALDLEEQAMTVNVDGRGVTYDWLDADELVLAYAASVHKAQGSEYPCVVLPLLTQHYLMLQRNLLYTAVTRAKKLVVIVGSRRALAMAVKNNKVAQRYSALDVRLRGDQR
jgi:exodeoxyribonuclease V alpha subunit